MSVDHIGAVLGGVRKGVGEWLVRCPCPNHGKGRGDRSPSLSIGESPGGQFLVHCFAGCDFREVMDELRRRGLIDDREPLPARNRFTPTVRRFAEPSPDVGALAIWEATVEAQETPADEYLNRRGIYLRPPMLRYRRDRGSMVAGVQAPNGKVIAIQQTWLTDHGEKASGKRLTTGNLGGGAVRLGALGRIMGLAEGVETALSAMQMAGVTVWASLGASRLHSVELPPQVEEVHIFVDNDEPGRSAARRAGDLHTTAGRKVYLRSPPDNCGDWNDFLNLIADQDGRDVEQAEASEDAA
jgi:putative DNA primase/helicase